MFISPRFVLFSMSSEREISLEVTSEQSTERSTTFDEKKRASRNFFPLAPIFRLIKCRALRLPTSQASCMPSRSSSHRQCG